jgi:Co/Zn/Cd efflux system component
MILEITCGLAFGSLALIGDGLHMSTHVCAFFISASAYSYARKHANNPRFVFGTGKVGDLAAYTSAIILAIISFVIIFEGITRFIKPEHVKFKEALPVAFIGLSVNLASGYVLMGGKLPCIRDDSDGNTAGHGHDHGHGHSHGHTVENYEIVDDGDEDTDDASLEKHQGHDHGRGHAHDHDESVNIKVGTKLF